MAKKDGSSDQRDEQQIDELLEIAGIARSAAARADCEIALSLAQSAAASERRAKNRPKPKLLKQLEQSITKTRMLLGRVKRFTYTSNVGLEVHRAGDGVVKAQFMGIFGKHAEFPTIPEDVIVVLIDIQNLLRTWHDNVKRVPKRTRQNPGKPDKDAIVDYAYGFLSRHSSDNSKFAEFVKRFFETVTRKATGELDTVTGKLDWQNRKARKARRTERTSLMIKNSR